MEKNNLKIGDLVKVVNPGKGYSGFDRMAKFFKMKNWEYNRSLIGKDKNFIYKIINIHKHLSYSNRILVYIRNIKNQKEYIIQDIGLEYYEEFIKKEEFSL